MTWLFSYITSLNSNSRKAVTIQSTKVNNCIISHAQNTTALQPNVFLTGIHRLLVTKKGQSSLPGANHCSGQLQTAQSMSVLRKT
jgi:hypothetical protein